MPTGRIKWFSPAKGYGFITKESGGDVFLHYTGLLDPKDRRLFSGDEVEFEEVEDDKGRKAVKVRRIASGATKPAKGE